MPSPVPTPVAAAIGLVPAVLDGVRSLPAKAVQLPIHAVSHALTGLGTARRGYDDLADRGERLIARLRGTSFDELEDRFEDALQGTRLAAPYDKVEDALEDAADTVTAFVRSPRATAKKATGAVRSTAGKGVHAAADAVDELADRTSDAAEQVAERSGRALDEAARAATGTVAAAESEAGEVAARAAAAVAEAQARVDRAADEVADKAVEAGKPETEAPEVAAPAAEAPKGAPTPKATEPDSTRVETAASADVVETVERVAAVVGGTVLAHDDLPLPDYDHLTLGALRGKMRSLDLPQLVQLRDYEKAKANRLPVVTMLDNRIAKLASDPTAPLSHGDVSGPSPKASSAASPAKSPRKPRTKASPATTAPAPNAPHTAFGGLGGSIPGKA